MYFQGYINITRGRVFCKITGNKFIHEPLIIVFPGGPGFGHEIYEKHSGCFADLRQMLFFDPIGSGKSSSPDNADEYTIDNYVSDAKEILDHFYIKKAIILGTSYGSVAALNFAIQYPSYVDKLILIAGAPSYHFLEAAKSELLKRGTAQQIEIAQTLFSGGFKNEQDVREYFAIMSPLYSNKAKREGVVPYKAKCSVVPLNSAFRNRFEMYDYRNQLHKITAPTYILVGEDDWINPIDQAQEIHKGIKHSALYVIKGAGHSVAIDRPDEYRSIISKLIKPPTE